MSKAELVAEVAKLSREERREVARLIFEMEEDVEILHDADRRANEQFLMLDKMEEDDCHLTNSAQLA